jgi:hypothetical protein
VIDGIAFRSSSLSFSVGVSPNLSSALLDKYKPRPEYAMMPTPMIRRVLGVMPLYHLERSQTMLVKGHDLYVLPNRHGVGVLDPGWL